jgi:hypothetical protein
MSKIETSFEFECTSAAMRTFYLGTTAAQARRRFEVFRNTPLDVQTQVKRNTKLHKTQSWQLFASY